jgi:hypothetical protein
MYMCVLMIEQWFETRSGVGRRDDLIRTYVVALEYCFYGSMKSNVTNNFKVAETYFRFTKHGGCVRAM